MKKKLYPFLQQYYLVIVTTLILFIIPFFWIKPGEMDLGGDGTRLYFYDPVSFFSNYLWYGISSLGLGNVEPHYDMIPFVSLLIILKFIFHSSYLLITISNILKFTGGFLFTYLIIKKLQEPLLKKKYMSEVSAILGGIFYIFMPPIQGNYERALIIQDQTFLNPLIFYLLLQYTLTRELRYLWVMLCVSVVFAHNFSWVAAPALFSFYPIVFVALYLYSKIVLKKSFPWKGYFLTLSVFLILHAFHIIPTLRNFFGGAIGARVFDSSNIQQLFDYVSSILSSSFLLDNLLVSPSIHILHTVSFIVPLIVTLGLLYKPKRNKTLVIFCLCFLITCFFVTGNISHIGSELYTKLFYIPGFSMFRDFRGKWFTSYSFFYALAFGLSLYTLSQKLSHKLFMVFSIMLSGILIVFGYPLWSGGMVNKILFQSNGIKNTIIFDDSYINTISKIKYLPDGKVLSLPFSDYDYQVISGKNNGAYVGVSPFPYLTGRETFSGYGDMIPLSDLFYKYSQSKNYIGINNLLSILGISYIYYNGDPKIYDTSFPQYPYQYIRDYLPISQNGYKEYLSHLHLQPIFNESSYVVYKRESMLPHIYIAKNITIYNKLNASEKSLEKVLSDDNVKHNAYISLSDCQTQFKDISCDSIKTLSSTDVTYKKISPVKYKITIRKSNQPMLLVFLEGFNNKWQITIPPTPKKSFLDELVIPRSIPAPHIVVNGYANGWILSKKDISSKNDMIFFIEMVDQRIFYYSLIISVVSLVIFLSSMPIWFKRKQL